MERKLKVGVLDGWRGVSVARGAQAEFREKIRKEAEGGKPC